MREEEFFERILHAINRLERNQETMMANQADFDTSLDTLIAAEVSWDAAITKSLTDLMAKVAAGTVTTPADMTAELTKIQALQSAAAAITAEATKDDPGPTTVTPPVK